MKISIYLVIILTLFLQFVMVAQNPNTIDSLKQIYNNASHDTTKVSALLYLGDQYLGTDYEMAHKYYLEALEIVEKLKAFQNKSDEKNRGVLVSGTYNSLGIINYYKGEFSRALDEFQKATETKEKFNIIEFRAYNNMGIIHFEMKNYEKAEHYFNKHLNFYQKHNSLIEVGNALCWIGNLKYSLKEFDMAIDYYEQYYDICETHNNLDGMSIAVSNIGSIYQKINEPRKALEYMKKSLEIDLEQRNYRGVAISYANIGSTYKKLKNYSQAVRYLSLGINHATDLNALPLLQGFYSEMVLLYEEMGDFEKALGYVRLHIQVKDSLFSLEKTKQIEELETKYEVEKKNLENENLKKESQLQIAENKRQKTVLIFLIAGLSALLIFLFFIIRLFMQKKKAHKLISERNVQLTMANEEIKTQKEEIEAQRDEIAINRDTVVQQKTEIEDSIKYAKRIQNAVMPLSKNPEKLLNKHFIIFQPKDVVSGDFYWAVKSNENLIIAVADCTGHGVPGAFMSMLGISFLNEIIRKKEVNNPAEVLSLLRESVVESLQQDEKTGVMQHEHMQDGMDMSLIFINLKTYKCLWAGANLPIWIIKKNTNEIQEFKPDKMPVGIYPKMNDFSNHEINLNVGDRIYLFSDGLPDQFGGPVMGGRKFKYSTFKKLLSETAHLKIDEQGKKVEENLYKWMHGYYSVFEQIDDITVLSVELT